MSVNHVTGRMPSPSPATYAATKNISVNKFAVFLDIRGLISLPANGQGERRGADAADGPFLSERSGCPSSVPPCGFLAPIVCFHGSARLGVRSR
jgi:hypothetical protein